MVARIIKPWHDKWLITPGAKGQRQNDRDFRGIINTSKLENRYAPEDCMDK
jgi:hypothetical protein